jgi:hypothetical protein
MVWQLKNSTCMPYVQLHHARQMPAVMLVHLPVLEEQDFATIMWLHAVIEGTHDGNAKMLRDSSDRMYKIQASKLFSLVALVRPRLLDHSPS